MNAVLFLGLKYERLTLTLEQVCNELSIAIGTAHNMLSAGTFPIPTRKEGRNRVADVRDLAEYIDAMRAQAIKEHEAQRFKS
jgi:predicted site-specific integrase-resolvase